MHLYIENQTKLLFNSSCAIMSMKYIFLNISYNKILWQETNIQRYTVYILSLHIINNYLYYQPVEKKYIIYKFAYPV